MKTNYPLKSKPRRENRWKLIAVISVFAVLSFFGLVFPNFSRSAFYALSKPVWFSRDVTFSSFSSITNYFKLKSSLIAQNKALQEQIDMLKLKEVDYDVLQKENDDLKVELGRNMQSKRMITRVLSKPPRSPYDTVVIDAGSSDGVVLGNKVYMGDNIIVGQVSNVTPHTSLVELFSNGDRKQEAILARTGATFTLVGAGAGNLKLEVPKDTDILWGDSFVYPSLSSSVIGSVYYIDTNSQSSFKTAYIRVPFNVFSSKYLFVEQ